MASHATSIFIGAGPGGAQPQQLELKRANRHGLIAGATGTGKTVTLQGIIEGLADAGVPTFVADVKGDLGGLAMPGSPTARSHDAFAAETFGDRLQGHRLAGAGGAGDQPVPIGAPQHQPLRMVLSLADEDAVRHVASTRCHLGIGQKKSPGRKAGARSLLPGCI